MLHPLRRLLHSILPGHVADSIGARTESCPPLLPQRRLGWDVRMPGRSAARAESLAHARLEFDDALLDVRTPASQQLQSRIAVARSMHELWHFREELFSLVSRRHDQVEAARRLGALDRHFDARTRPLRRRAESPLPAAPQR